jgi:hypothetical protein
MGCKYIIKYKMFGIFHQFVTGGWKANVFFACGKFLTCSSPQKLQSNFWEVRNAKHSKLTTESGGLQRDIPPVSDWWFLT